MFVYLCATFDKEMYFYRAYKRNKEMPVEDYQGILIHDHESAFYNYRSAHQDCPSVSKR